MEKTGQDAEQTIVYPNRVFIGGLSRETTELELETFFSNFGTVLDVRIVCDRKTGANKGFGFVTYTVIETAQQLINKNVDYKGRSLRCRQARRKKGGGQYAGNESDDKGSDDGQWVLVPVGGVTTPPTPRPQAVQYYTLPDACYPANGSPTYYQMTTSAPQMYYVPASVVGGTTYYYG